MEEHLKTLLHGASLAVIYFHLLGIFTESCFVSVSSQLSEQTRASRDPSYVQYATVQLVRHHQ